MPRGRRTASELSGMRRRVKTVVQYIIRPSCASTNSNTSSKAKMAAEKAEALKAQIEKERQDIVERIISLI
jgi:hypothetical protein